MIRKILFGIAFLFTAAALRAAPVSYVQIATTTRTQSGGFHTSTGTVDTFTASSETITTTLVVGTATVTGHLLGAGTSTNDSAPAGYIGEVVRAAVLFNAGVPLANGVSTSISTITLTAGDWDIRGAAAMTGTATGTLFAAGFSTTANTIPAAATLPETSIQIPTMPTSNADSTITLPSSQVKLSSPTNYYLVINAAFTVGSPKGYGVISARRMR